MKILVAVKRVLDPSLKVHIKPDGSGVDTLHAKGVMNPFDEIALEAAIRLREQGVVQTVMVVSLGDQVVQETLRHGLALGADHALHIEADATMLEPLHVAHVLAAVAESEQVSAVLLGKQAVDDDANQVGQMLAGHLGWAQATFASQITWDATGVMVVREVDAGLETVHVPLPAVLTADLRLNEPRFVSLPNLLKAKAKPIQKKTVAELGVTCIPHVTTLMVEAPPTRTAGERFTHFSAVWPKIVKEL